MFYAFDVVSGTTLKFEKKFASVEKLQEEIEKTCGASPNRQILMMSGGEKLKSSVDLSTHCIGTMSNPIFLFKSSQNEPSDTDPSSPGIDVNVDSVTVELRNLVFESADMPRNYKTLVARNQIAQQFYIEAREMSRLCEAVVKEHHWQQQGWSAIVAYMEDVTNSCRVTGLKLLKNYDNYTANFGKYMEILKTVEENVKVLENIPILPALREKSINSLSNEANTDADKAEEESNLLNWITPERITQMVDDCSAGLKNFDNKDIASLKQEMSQAIMDASEENLKDIKNVCDRLYLLEENMDQVKRTLQQQDEIATVFRATHDRIASAKMDASCAAMCASHHDHLVMMLQYHEQLFIIWQKLVKSKEKLCNAIGRRFERIVDVIKNIEAVNDKVALFNNDLVELCNKFETLRQILQAPEMYVAAVVEVVRRKNFSQAYLDWTSNLVREMKKLHNQEMKRRQEFMDKFKGHFLNNIFTGLDDIPPAFATEEPPVFDDRLPNLTLDDIEFLKSKLPEELNERVVIPDLNTTDKSLFELFELYEDKSGEMQKSSNVATSNPGSSNPSFTRETDSSGSVSIAQNSEDSIHIETDDSQRSQEVLNHNAIIEDKCKKIQELQALIEQLEKEGQSEEATSVTRKKLAFEMECLQRLRYIFREIDRRKKDIKTYQERILHDKKDIKKLEKAFKESLDKYQNDIKEVSS